MEAGKLCLRPLSLNPQRPSTLKPSASNKKHPTYGAIPSNESEKARESACARGSGGGRGSENEMKKKDIGMSMSMSMSVQTIRTNQFVENLGRAWS